MIDQIANQVLGLAEIGGNRLLGLDPEVLKFCAELQGKIVALELTDLDKSIYCHPGSWGLRLSLQKPGKEVDARIKGRVFGLINLSLQEHKVSTSIQERIEITGNPAVAQKFQQILTEIDIDWEEQLSRITGDILAFRLGQGLRKTHRWIKESFDSVAQSSRDYLQEEARHLPTNPEFNQFKKGVTDMRYDVDRLEALLTRYLQNKINNPK
jgi:ubiquinone biosynthesis protein UbiJ